MTENGWIPKKANQLGKIKSIMFDWNGSAVQWLTFKFFAGARYEKKMLKVFSAHLEYQKS